LDKPWYAHYAPGVPHDINPDLYKSLIDYYDKHSEEFLDSVAFINMSSHLTYGELHDLSVRFAAYLQSIGLRKGSRVAIMMPNLLQYAVAMFGILRAGMVVVNVNPLYTAPEVVHQLEDAGAEVMVVLANFASTVEKALPKLPKITEVIVTEIGDLMGSVKGKLINFAVKHFKKMVPKYNIENSVTFKYVLTASQSFSFKPATVGLNDIAFLQYTGGTTGVPKGAMLTHRNMISNVLQCSKWMGHVIDRDNVAIAALPMYHIFSLTVCCLTFVCLGARVVLVTNPRHMKSFLKILAGNKISVFVGLNTLFNGLLHQPKFKNMDFSGLKLTVSGGMAMQSSVAQHWHDVTGCHVTEGYGLTETSPVVTINPLTNTEFSGSIGLPVSSTDVTIRDEFNKDLDLGEVGELCVKGPQVMSGYYNKPEETAHVMDSEGWLHTGDVGRIDEDGYVYIVDRKKDMILISGFNVYPNEIEEVLAQSPHVDEVAVIGVPYEKTGETIKAFIVPAHDEVTEKHIKDHCYENLTRYKIPRFIEFREELPKSNVGKVLRRELKNEVPNDS
jgi:long-chain acyl-CoA synthetase